MLMAEKRCQEAVRIKAEYIVDGMSHKKTMAVDPAITSFSDMMLLLRKAFDLLGDFQISYLLPKSQESSEGKDLFLSLSSDIELDAAFSTASHPHLFIKIEDNEGDWSIIQSDEAPNIQDIRSNFPQLPLKAIVRNEITRTFSRFVDIFAEMRKQPVLREGEFISFFDHDGRLVRHQDLRIRVFSSGMENRIRKETWTHLLGVFPQDLSLNERTRFLMMRHQVYHHLKQNWLERKPEDINDVMHMIQKDVLRTDRNHSFFNVPEDHPNLVSLFNILTTYALNHPEVLYCQGMSDLASPLLVVMEDEAVTYWCFCALMQRMKVNFMQQGCGMTENFQYLSTFLKKVDKDLYNHLQKIAAENLFFCYRMLLLDMKREFPFEDALNVLECIWSSIPVELTDRETMASFYYRIYEANMPSRNTSLLEWEGLYLKRFANDDQTDLLPHPWLVNAGALMTLLICLSILLVNKEQILEQTDYNGLGIYFDKLVRQHDANKVLSKAKGLYLEYVKAFLEGQTVDSKKSFRSGCYGTQSDGIQC